MEPCPKLGSGDDNVSSHSQLDHLLGLLNHGLGTLMLALFTFFIAPFGTWLWVFTFAG